MKLNLTPLNMTTKQAHEYLRIGFTNRSVIDKIGHVAAKIIIVLEREYKAERKAGLPSFYVPSPIQNKAITYLEGLQGVPPSWEGFLLTV